MRNLRSLILGLGCVLGGVFLANYFGAELGAQQQVPTEVQGWEIYHGVYSRQAVNNDTRFYVIRHNTLTGETQIIGCEDRDGCTQFVVEIED